MAINNGSSLVVLGGGDDDDDARRDDFRDRLGHAREVDSAPSLQLPLRASVERDAVALDSVAARSAVTVRNSDAGDRDGGLSETYATGLTDAQTNVPATVCPALTARTTSSTPVVVKAEALNVAAHLLDMPESNKVKIYVGTSANHFTVLRENLINSPVLESWVTETGKDWFIMRPELLNIRADDLEVIIQYLHTKEYTPTLIEDPNNPRGPKLWEMVAARDYSTHLLCAGRYYVLAQMLQIQGMPENIYDKITSVDASRFSMKSLLGLATILFDDGRAPSPHPQTDINTDDNTENAVPSDKLEGWVIGRIALSVKQIMLTEQSLFWHMEISSRRRRLVAKILAAASELYEATGKINESVIELE